MGLQKQEQQRNMDWVLFLNERGEAQQSFILLEHIDSSFVKFKLHPNDDTLIMIPISRILKIKDRRNKDG